ncbi:hypothetical protein GXW71_08815 [Roseomonas hellenica]|uniref:Uncharacterized protein n=1 Tax=Plastoroseomonas hellenica TaxID=2687306 RepID=A0ABS5EVY2_9PROT|nr:hypothetical protein [Plastoroseomonas hellenica]MBR0664454.1 hypothetical protein [Plastoroseomonas hellenica]
MAVEYGINWAPDRLVTEVDVLIPTYGNYGAPHYTGGLIDPGYFVDVAPIDPLDALFKAHDFAYFAIPSTDVEALARSDLALISDIMALDDSQMGGEAHLYAAGAELALLYNVVENYEAGALLTPEQTVAITADAANHLQLATIEPQGIAEQIGLAQILSQNDNVW